MYCYRDFIRFYNLDSNFKKAFYFSQKYNSLSDSMANSARHYGIQQMETIFTTSIAEKENAILSKDLEINEKQKNYWIVIAVLILLVAIVTYNRYHVKKTDSEQLRRLNTMKDTLLRIIAHDLKTPFNVIFGYTEILKTDFILLI